MTALSIVAALLFPVLIGWAYGRNQIDPNTPEGRAYYAKREPRT